MCRTIVSQQQQQQHIIIHHSKTCHHLRILKEDLEELSMQIKTNSTSLDLTNIYAQSV